MFALTIINILYTLFVCELSNILHLKRKNFILPQHIYRMTLKSNEDYEQQRNRQVSKMRSALDYIMGALIVFIGVFLLARGAFDFRLNKIYPPDVWDKVYGVIVILYGSWRIYRAYKKNYFK